MKDIKILAIGGGLLAAILGIAWWVFNPSSVGPSNTAGANSNDRPERLPGSSREGEKGAGLEPGLSSPSGIKHNAQLDPVRQPSTVEELARIGVSGRVVAQDTGRGIEAAKIAIKGTGTLAYVGGDSLTDKEGNWTVKLGFLPLDPFEAHAVLGDAAFYKPEPFFVTATKDGYASARDVRVTINPAEPANRMNPIELRPASSITGIVYNEAGQPVPGVHVNIHFPPKASQNPRKPAPEPAAANAKRGPRHGDGTPTGAAGEFTFINVPAGEYDLHALSMMHGEAVVRVTAPRQGTVEVRLTKGMAISGRVLDSTGNPVRRARVAAQATGGNDRQVTVLNATTDAQGNFGIFNLAGTNYTVTAAHNTSTVKAENVAPGGAPLELKFEVGGGVTGRVLDSNGVPLDKYNVRITQHRDDPYGLSFGGIPDLTPETWPDGVYNFAMQPAGTYRIYVTAAGHERGERIIEVEDGKTTICDFQLKPNAELTGIVVYADGTPAAGAYIQAFGKRAASSDDRPTPIQPPWRTPGMDKGAQQIQLARTLKPISAAISGADGRFTLTGLIGYEYHLAVRHGASVTELPLTITTGERREGFVITLKNPGSLTLTVVNTRNEAVTNFPVRLMRVSSSPDPGRIGSTDASGIAKFSDIQPGSYFAQIEAQLGTIHHGEELLRTRVEVNIGEGQAATAQLTVAAPVSVTLTVYKDGQPLEEGTLRALPLDPVGPERRAPLTSGGRCVVEGLAAGRVRFEYAPNRELWAAEVTLSDSAMNFANITLVRER